MSALELLTLSLLASAFCSSSAHQASSSSSFSSSGPPGEASTLEPADLAFPWSHQRLPKYATRDGRLQSNQ